MKWITALILSVVATFASATPEAEALQIQTPAQDDFYVNPDARVTLRFTLMPDEFTAPVMVKVWLDGGFSGTLITSMNSKEVDLGVLSPGEHTVMLEASGLDQHAKTKPVTFSVRKPPASDTGSVIQLQ